MIIKDFGYKAPKVNFSDGNHTYRLEGVLASGVTSVIGRKDKDWKGLWMMKEAGRYLMENIKPDTQYKKTELLEFIKASKKAYLNKSNQATDSGKIAHALIEESIITRKRFDPSKFNYETEQTTKEVANIYGNWLLWEAHHPDIEYLATELVMADKELWVAGTADCIAIIDGELCLIDWKSSKQFSEDLFLQSAAYKYMLIKGGVTRNIVRRGVRLDKGVDADGVLINDYAPEYFEHNDIIIPTDYEKDLACFKALREVDKWCKNLNKEYSTYKKVGKSGWYVLNINNNLSN